MADEVDISRQLEVLNNVMGARRYEMTPFEADVWVRIIQSTTPERFIAFIQHHYMTSPFAPNPSDATKFLDAGSNPDVVFTTLQRLVATVGPYSDPDVKDPMVVATVQALGGWVRVNEEMPDPKDSYGMKAYRDRFSAAFNTAVAQVRVNGEIPLEPLKGLGHSPKAALGFQASSPLASSSLPQISSQRPKP